MAGLKLVTDLDAEKALRVAWRTARDVGFRLPLLDEGGKSFQAKKGHMLLNLLVGAFAPRCHFLISVEHYDSGTEVVLEDQSVKVTAGTIGAGKIHRQAE